MKSQCILISGPNIAEDEGLVGELAKCSLVLRNSDYTQIESIIQNKKVDLILIEILNNTFRELELIKNIKHQFPNIPIVLINGNGNRDIIAEAFELGVKDAFRIPYKRTLIVERVNALLGER